MTPLTRIQMVVYLQSVELFTHCTAEQMVRIASIARQRTLSRRQAIYAVNDSAAALYCVVEGEVSLMDGDTAVERKVGPGDTFGVREILSDRLRGEHAVAVADGVALEIDAEDFFDLLSNNIEIVKALFRQLLRAPREDGSVAELTSSNPHSRPSTDGGPRPEMRTSEHA